MGISRSELATVRRFLAEPKAGLALLGSRGGVFGRLAARGLPDVSIGATERAVPVLAVNPSPMTLTGTNTWIVAEPGARRAVVVDPGPNDGRHLRAVLAAVRARGMEVGQILLTHGHHDHAAGAKRFARMSGAPVRALDPRHRHGGEGLAEGDVIALDGLELRVWGTPGHTGDSLSFWLPADGSVLTGDTVLGYGTTIVSDLGDYLESLERMRDHAAENGIDRILPGHGPILAEPVKALDTYLGHRRARLEQVRAALEAGASTAREVVESVYADVDRKLWPAAEWSVQAQMDYLASGR
ncbi:MBL fold metallo-hydrolase [Actinocorallia sp. API 0066]|uniref:MBL fold metallo-hydrolase n=1 Tax=Actinocorallia sp. API 0066 TaxID=2896846 RepID=UPI001E44065E|nr:MBL fold metallo-hydrolase [Actinocorallia sp. API 0066]MCD0450645.1 MBL fold metallo-hydrolase [Actinocorallia sp. API 0066]